MAKKFDSVVLTFLVYTLIFLWSRFFIKDLIWSLVFSGAVCFLFALGARALFGKIKKRPYSAERLNREFAMRGNAYAAEIIKGALDNPFVELDGNMLKLGTTFLVCNFKFAYLSAADVAGVYQTARQKGAKKVVLLCKGVERYALSLTVELDVKFEIVRTGAVFRFLYDKKSLPDLKKENPKFSFGYIFDAALKRQNAKFYVFSGIMLLFLSYFTMLKLYYLCFGTSLFVLAILCLSPLGRTGEEKKYKVIDGFSRKANLNDLDEKTIRVNALLDDFIKKTDEKCDGEENPRD